MNEAERNYERMMKALPNDEKIREDNKQKILDFLQVMSANGIGKARQGIALWRLRTIGRVFQIPFEEATKDTIVRLLDYLEKKYKSKSTMNSYRSEIKLFWRWLKNTKEDPPEVSWIKIIRNRYARFTKEDLLTEEDVIALADVAVNQKSRILPLMLYMSGCRIGELLGLKIKDIKFHTHGCVLSVNGKTGARRIPFPLLHTKEIDYVGELLKWLDRHPTKNNQDAYVFVPFGRSTAEVIGRLEAQKILKRLANAAGIKKKVNPHWFRHSIATRLAPKLREPIMRKLFGWTATSKTPSLYYHLAQEDVDEAIFKMNNMQVSQEEIKPIGTKQCPNCGDSNSILSHFCKSCSSFLDLSLAWKMKDDAVAMVLDKLREDPAFDKKIRKIVKKLKLEKRFEIKKEVK